MGYRKIVPAQTLKVNEKTGEIESSTIPETIVFKIDGKIRPVAPFLEVFAVLENSPKKKGAPEKLVKLDRAVLKKLGASRAKIEWRVSVANRKVMRRTENLDDMVAADTGWFQITRSMCSRVLARILCQAATSTLDMRASSVPTIDLERFGSVLRRRKD